MENVIDKYPGKVVMLAINISPEEDHEVLPFVKRRGYDFLPLKVPHSGWARERYQVTMAPINFLLGPNGRVFYKPRVDAENEDVFAYEIDSLLAHGPAGQKGGSGDSVVTSGKE